MKLLELTTLDSLVGEALDSAFAELLDVAPSSLEAGKEELGELYELEEVTDVLLLESTQPVRQRDAKMPKNIEETRFFIFETPVSWNSL